MRAALWALVLGSLVSSSGCDNSAVDPFDSITVMMDAPSTAAVGESITVTFAVVNLTDRTVQLELGGPAESAFDVMVSSEDGALMWRRHVGPVARPAGRLVLEPYASRMFATTWDLRDASDRPVPPGTYQITGILEGVNQVTKTAEPTVRLTITGS